MDRLSEGDKRCLTKYFSELEFLEDVKDYCCVDCRKLALYSTISSCGHIFCQDCEISIYTKNCDYYCPTCQETIIDLTKTSGTFEKNLCELVVKCPKVKNGCTTLSELKELAAHIKLCKFFKETPTEVDKLQMPQMFDKITLAEENIQSLQKPIGSNPIEKVEILGKNMSKIDCQLNLLSQALPNAEPNSEDSIRKSQNEQGEKPTSANFSALLQKFSNLEREGQTQGNHHKSISKHTFGLSLSTPVLLLQSGQTLLKKRVDSENQFKISEHSTQNSNQRSYNLPDVPPKSVKKKRFNGINGKKYNILLLGENGVGKSTFINALCNYLKFSSLEEARRGKLSALVANKFEIPDNNHQTKTIFFGRNHEEKTRDGQSVTQNCNAYEIPVDDFTIRIIDTPGIGDIRGLDQDRLNLEGMLKFISSYKELYAICILLKPNESKLTPSFTFCIKQLFCHLNQKASDNFVFIFTHSRSTFYRPGDIVTPLTGFLKKIEQSIPHPKIQFIKENIFCLDNESFRFLIALENNIKFKEINYENFEQSWLKSVEESSRLIKYIVEGDVGHGLKPQLVAEMITH